MSAVVIAGDVSGTVTLDAPAVAGTTVLTLPATSGRVLTQNPSAPADSFVVNASGNVGIGTSSPTQKLHVSSAGDNVILSAAGSGAAGYIAANGGNRSGLTGAINIISYSNGIAEITNKSNASLVFGTNDIERMRIQESGNVRITQTPGRYTIDTTGGATVISNGATVDFANASGMLVVNNFSSGAVTIWLCGGGSTNSVSNVGGVVGSLSYVAGIDGYRWTNNSGTTTSFGFFFLRTRPGA
jgi:hypothetical protein